MNTLKLFSSSAKCYLLFFNIHKKTYFIPTRRYGPLRGPTSSSCGGLRPSAESFLTFGQKRELIMLFWTIFGNFWCPVVTLVTFSTNLSNFKRNPQKNPKKVQKFQKFLKIQNPKKIKKSKKSKKN